MMENAAYIQKELPSLEMPDDLRTSSGKLCDELIGTKHDLMHEIFAASEWLESEPDRFDLWRELIRPWKTVRPIRSSPSLSWNPL